MQGFAGKVAVVTGAGSGIGQGLAIELGRSGASVAISDVDTDVIDVLTSLGFSIVEAQTALQNLPREAKTVDERVQLALQHLDQG